MDKKKETEFEYLEKGTPVQSNIMPLIEIAYQLKRIADNLEESKK